MTAPIATSPTKVVVSSKPAPKSNYAANKAFAEQMSGYNSKSPIWGKSLPEVLDMIVYEITAGNNGDAIAVVEELKRRVAKGKLMKAQR